MLLREWVRDKTPSRSDWKHRIQYFKTPGTGLNRLIQIHLLNTYTYALNKCYIKIDQSIKQQCHELHA